MLDNTLILSSNDFFENTAKIIPPDGTNSKGAVVVSTGSPYGILRRPLYTSTGQIDTSSPTQQANLPLNATQAIGTDNQIVRAKDGSLLCLRAGSVWSPASPAV